MNIAEIIVKDGLLKAIQNIQTTGDFNEIVRLIEAGLTTSSEIKFKPAEKVYSSHVYGEYTIEYKGKEIPIIDQMIDHKRVCESLPKNVSVYAI